MTKIHQTLFCDAIPQGLLGRFNLVNHTPSDLISDLIKVVVPSVLPPISIAVG